MSLILKQPELQVGILPQLALTVGFFFMLSPTEIPKQKGTEGNINEALWCVA